MKGYASVELWNGIIREAEIHWYEAHGIGRKVMSDTGAHPEFVVCLRNDEFPASLEVRKIYRTIEDADALRAEMVRIIDESGEDYLFPASYFAPLPLPDDLRERFLKAG